VSAGPTNELPPVHEAWLPKEHSLHRPRHGRRQLTALMSALVFFATPALMWVFGMRAGEIENHKLAAFPSIADGWGMFTGLDEWATDNLAFRGGAVNTTDWISRTIFGEPAPFDQGGDTKPTGPLPGSPSEPVPADPQQAEPGDGGETSDGSDAGFRRVIEGTDDWLYFGTDTLNKCHPQVALDQTMTQLVNLRTAIEASGRKLVLVVVPDKTTMFPEHLPASYPGKECADAVTPDLWQKVIQVAGDMDIRPRLAAAADDLGKPVYYPQDTHWTNEGALAMVDSLAEQIKPGVTDRWRIQANERYSAAADLPPLIGKNGKNNATSYRLRPNGRTDRADPGTSDLFEPLHRKSSPLTGQVFAKTAVLGDSFLVAASRYLPAAFSDVTMQYYLMAGRDPAQVIKTIGDAEIVVVEIVERNIAAGTPEILSQGFIDSLAPELAKRPVR
jgi:alginate O-acetyltransferase complex protein AlgJ